jgi:hypothetical protein
MGNAIFLWTYCYCCAGAAELYWPAERLLALKKDLALWEYQRREVQMPRCRKLRFFFNGEHPYVITVAWALFVHPWIHDTGTRKRMNWCRTVLDIGRERHDEKWANRCDDITWWNIMTWNWIIPPISSFCLGRSLNFSVGLIVVCSLLYSTICFFFGFRISGFVCVVMQMWLPNS